MCNTLMIEIYYNGEWYWLVRLNDETIANGVETDAPHAYYRAAKVCMERGIPLN